MPLSVVDKQVNELTREQKNPQIWADWYIRTPTSGTYLDVDDDRPYWVEKTQPVNFHWLNLGKPTYFGPIDGVWTALDKKEYLELKSDVKEVYHAYKPGKFYWHHGYRFLDGHTDIYTSPQLVKVVVGGMASGKTEAVIIAGLVDAATLPFCNILFLAPYARQSREIHAKIGALIRNTRFKKSYNIVSFLSPEPGYKIQTGEVLEDGTPIESIIMCVPLANPDSLKTLEFDIAIIDQFELLDNIANGKDSTLAMVQSRLRGFEKTFNRPRVSTSYWVANASNNSQVWDFADRHLYEPDQYFFLETDTEKNPYLTKAQLATFRSTYGRTEADIDYYFKGRRPIGDGEIFPASSIEACFSPEMDELFNTQYGNEGYIRIDMQGIGLQRWAIPYDRDGKYIVSADPGWSNPPDRNSACVYTFRIDDFPEKPATLYAFEWVMGYANPQNWIEAFLRDVVKYHAVANCAYDATGWQRGYARNERKLVDVGAYEVNINQAKKNSTLNVLRMLMAKGLLKMPRQLSPVINQLMNYVLPEPPKLRQDLVAGLLIVAHQLDIMYNQHIWANSITEAQPKKTARRHVRSAYDRPYNRHKR